jgi:hypothetical protein
MSSRIPQNSYGIIYRDSTESDLDLAADQIRRLGYAVVHSGFSETEIADVATQFDRLHYDYKKKWGEKYLQSIDDYFFKLAFNENIISVVSKLITGKFILNQQNGIVNPANKNYNQGSWHRDLPYQHFISTSPLAINALYCVDEFTPENGATFVIPASHKVENFPDFSLVEKIALQVSAPAGSYIVLDCMTYHAGGSNVSAADRRAVNHAYTIPFFRQQIRLSDIVKSESLTPKQKEILGTNYNEPLSIEEYLKGRPRQ